MRWRFVPLELGGILAASGGVSTESLARVRAAKVRIWNQRVAPATVIDVVVR